VENELLDPEAMPEPFRNALLDYLGTLERYRLLTYGQQVVRAVRELEREPVLASVRAELRHLIVDEYQDVNAHRASPARSGPVRKPQLSRGIGRGRRPLRYPPSGLVRGRP
jgi:superfamily I DNA/RNA helicase